METQKSVTELKNHGYWRMAMPLDEMYSMLSEGNRIWIAEEGEMYPNFEIWFVSTDVKREALTITSDEGQIEISPLELQIAYKLRLAQASDSLSGKDFEDALHLYFTFEERFKESNSRIPRVTVSGDECESILDQQHLDTSNRSTAYSGADGQVPSAP
ncbi:hypothetical protein [Natronosalvus halobius]|uniref:hypothetical protein n=1 Tax=Natronosalvus halobius TaxID=2953746 RepID=UPI00209E38FB|nr:hypothetical protein [Natronosalvus halobius]USZ73518.1 hypothetical protein NGM15_17800 [Natronosalvus halobius]